MPAPGRLASTLTLSLLLLGSARALEPGALDLQLRVRAAPRGSWENSGSPYAPAAGLTGIGAERGRGEVELRLRAEGLTADLAWRLTSLEGARPDSQGVVNELFAGAELLGQHLTLGKKVLSWDVGFAFRPLDVIQQEDRRAFLPFALEGVPLLAWERFGETSATSLVYANPLRGRAPTSRDDESVALRHYDRISRVGLDLHLVARWSQRTGGEAGLAAAVVLGEAVEVHGSGLYQQRVERLVDARLEPGAALLSASDPVGTRVSPDAVSALAGITVTPGRDLSFLAEAWLDPAGSSEDEWRALAGLARAQGALLGNPQVPREAVLANLAYGARFLGRRNLSRHSLLLRASQRWDRLEPSLDLLFTPEDGGLVATAALTYEGERSRLAAGLRALGGKRDSPARLFPESGSFFVSWELHL